MAVQNNLTKLLCEALGDMGKKAVAELDLSPCEDRNPLFCQSSFQMLEKSIYQSQYWSHFTYFIICLLI